VSSEIIKNVIISQETLPGVDAQNKHYVRYRIISEDKNRVSEWSPIYNINGIKLPEEMEEGSVSVSGEFIVVRWSNIRPIQAFDIYVKYDAGDYAYVGSSSNNTYSFVKNSSASAVSVSVHPKSSIKTYSDKTSIYTGGTTI
jgi:hypothetical protein